MKSRKFTTILAVSLVAIMGAPIIPAKANEIQCEAVSYEATVTDANSEDDTYSHEDIKAIRVEGEIKHTGRDVGPDDAISVEVAGIDLDKYRNLYVYTSLTSNEKKFYNQLESMAKKFMNTNIDADVTSENAIAIDEVSYYGLTFDQAENVVAFFINQNPQYYFLSGGYIYSPYYETIAMAIYPEFANGYYRSLYTMQFFNAVDKLVNTVNAKTSDYDKAKECHDQVCKITQYTSHGDYIYDYDKDWYINERSAWNAVMKGKANSEGYAKIYALLANACGIETIIQGIGYYDSQYNECCNYFNKSYVDGNWYYVDCSLDDRSNKINYDFFLISYDRIRMLDNYSSRHATNTRYSGRVPSCPNDYSPDNPPTGTVPPTPSLSSASICIAQEDSNGILAGLSTNVDKHALEFSWYASADNGKTWMLISDWTPCDEWMIWKPDRNDTYLIVGKARKKGTSDTVQAAYEYHSDVTIDKLISAEIRVDKEDINGISARLSTNLDGAQGHTIEYSWYASADDGKSWTLIKDWTANDAKMSWRPRKNGAYLIVGKAREKGKNEIVQAQYEYEYHSVIKGKCQMPYTGPGGGYLIGVESYDNPNQSYRYEMLILDCTLLAQGKDAWTYTTGKCPVVSGNALWTIWQPQYGYYWTLFRVYDYKEELLDEACYGFVNAY